VIPAIYGLVKGFRLPSDDGFENQPPSPANKPIKRPRRISEPAG
jgi:Cu(I)/Ag(I) efflux system membrane protein CusA/SilA